nr:hypothetical protein [Candidatus Sigynarchaeota archaeon]
MTRSQPRPPLSTGNWHEMATCINTRASSHVGPTSTCTTPGKMPPVVFAGSPLSAGKPGDSSASSACVPVLKGGSGRSPSKLLDSITPMTSLELPIKERGGRNL